MLQQRGFGDYTVMYTVHHQLWWAKTPTVNHYFLLLHMQQRENPSVTAELQPMQTQTRRMQRLASFLLLPGSTANLTFPQWHQPHCQAVSSFTFESIFNFSLIHSHPVSTKTLSLAKISFWQTMQWIKGHTWPLSCSLGDQTHFQGQELLTSLFNQGGETRNLRWARPHEYLKLNTRTGHIMLINDLKMCGCTIDFHHSSSTVVVT